MRTLAIVWKRLVDCCVPDMAGNVAMLGAILQRMIMDGFRARACRWTPPSP